MYFEDFTLHQTIAIPPAAIERQAMMDFARAYDHIPLHTDEEYARTTHFGGLIAPGVMSYMAVWSKFLEVDPVGSELIAGQSTQIEWFKPVYPGDVLTGEAEITGLIPRSHRNGTVEVTVRAYNQRGELALTGVSRAVVKRRPDNSQADK